MIKAYITRSDPSTWPPQVDRTIPQKKETKTMETNVFKISEIFKSNGQPEATYVQRQNGKFENSLIASLNAKGKICLLTGPSKTGKSTLYNRVLQDRNQEPLVIRCDGTINADEFWRKALEEIKFDRIAQLQKIKGSKTSGSGEIGGTIGWSWLAGLIGKVSIGVENSMSETQIREKILAKPSPAHLVPLLQKHPIVLVVEDFHYLTSQVKKNIFQQWKTFVDSEISVIVVGTTHHAVDIAFANKDLVGRVALIELSRWETSDLMKIVEKGFHYMDIPISKTVKKTIAEESVGLPIITQAACQQIFLDQKIHQVSKGQQVPDFSKKDSYHSLHNVAISSYGQFQDIYERLTMGPRKKARKYDTYEIVLSAFSKDPQTFLLRRHEIDARLNELPIPKQQVPPQNSINSMLRALGNFQKKMGIELLEWSEKVQTLYILEPAFLFYLRWREPRERPVTFEEMLTSISKLLSAFKTNK
ncbi:MAG: hypothetical protein NPIRA01_27650 [Nitrospirales bacterium]|nr:MAG: hypothetical protein NPIRA01_27650 [Nitrospirales bacterium]